MGYTSHVVENIHRLRKSFRSKGSTRLYTDQSKTVSPVLEKAKVDDRIQAMGAFDHSSSFMLNLYSITLRSSIIPRSRLSFPLLSPTILIFASCRMGTSQGMCPLQGAFPWSRPFIISLLECDELFTPRSRQQSLMSNSVGFIFMSSL